jgi:small subunit ribosomal protein S16
LLKIRLRRTGAKKQPSYRVVVAESTAPRDGTFLEILGHYNPLTEPTTFVIKEDRVLEWLKQGAQPTERVARLLGARGLIAAPAVPTTTSAATTTSPTTPAPATTATAGASA